MIPLWVAPVLILVVWLTLVCDTQLNITGVKGKPGAPWQGLNALDAGSAPVRGFDSRHVHGIRSNQTGGNYHG